MVRKLDKEKNYLNFKSERKYYTINQNINDENFKQVISKFTEYYDPDDDNSDLYKDLASALLKNNTLPNSKFEFQSTFESKDIDVKFDILDKTSKKTVKTFYLTTDYIGASKNKAQYAVGENRYESIDKSRLSLDEIVAFLKETRKIGGHIFLPTLIQLPENDKCEKRDVRTLNQAKGMSLNDRFDLYLLDLNNYYNSGETSKSMQPVFDYFSSWFDLFTDFKGYVNFFKLNDFVSDDYTQVINLLTGEYFDKGTKVTQGINLLPKDHDGYLAYAQNTVKIIKKRTDLIVDSITEK